jgi:hypothetical protein
MYARYVLSKDTNMSAWFEEIHELMLMTFLRCGLGFTAKQRWRLYFTWTSIFAGRRAGGVAG